jgi:hypothetical protein
MGDPITTTLLVASTVTSAVGSYQQGKAAQSAANYNATISEARGKSEARRVRRMGKFQQGEIRASAGKAGVTMSGSALDALEEAVAVNEYDALMLKENAEDEAYMLRRKGQMAKRQGNLQTVSSILKGGADTYASL